MSTQTFVALQGCCKERLALARPNHHTFRYALMTCGTAQWPSPSQTREKARRDKGVSTTNKASLGAFAATLLLAALATSSDAPDEATSATERTAPQALPAASEPPLIPRRMYFDIPTRFRGRISPTGDKISFLAPVDGVQNIWVGPAGDIDAAKPITRDTSRGIRFYQWSASDEYQLFLRDVGGDENDHVHAIHLATGSVRDLTPAAGARVEIYGTSRTRPGLTGGRSGFGSLGRLTGS